MHRLCTAEGALWRSPLQITLLMLLDLDLYYVR